MNQAEATFALGTLDGSRVPLVAASLSRRDHVQGWAVRWGVRRMAYRVEPGLYGVGNPNPDSPVLVTANYKLSFDALRRELAGLDAWILVLDTKGINVWCAAGKGTFGTQELIQRIAATGLAKKVRHRELILPQLGATGVAGHIVKAFCGFRVIWGPVLAADLPAFLAAGRQKTQEMRTMRFDWRDRLVLAPMELVHGGRWVPVLVALALILAVPFDGGWLRRGLGNALILVGAWPVGTVLFPLALPYLPFRAFGLKGLVLGLGWLILALLGLAGLGVLGLSGGAALSGLLGLASASLVALPLIVYTAMNFTGASTFTCQTGALAEVRHGLPWLFASLGLGLALGITQAILRLVAGM